MVITVIVKSFMGEIIKMNVEQKRVYDQIQGKKLLLETRKKRLEDRIWKEKRVPDSAEHAIFREYRKRLSEYDNILNDLDRIPVHPETLKFKDSFKLA